MIGMALAAVMLVSGCGSGEPPRPLPHREDGGDPNGDYVDPGLCAKTCLAGGVGSCLDLRYAGCVRAEPVERLPDGGHGTEPCSCGTYIQRISPDGIGVTATGWTCPPGEPVARDVLSWGDHLPASDPRITCAYRDPFGNL